MNDKAKRSNELEKRLIGFAARVYKVSVRTGVTREGRHVGQQVLRSATSAAANYGEARAAQSLSDFIHKLGIVQKELNETQVWLRFIKESCLLKPELLIDILRENNELCRIVAAGIRTAKSRVRRSQPDGQSQDATNDDR